MESILKLFFILSPLIFWLTIMAFVIRLVFRLLKKDIMLAKKEAMMIFYIFSMFLNITTFTTFSLFIMANLLASMLIAIILSIIIFLFTKRSEKSNKTLFKLLITLQLVYIIGCVIWVILNWDYLNGPVGIYT